jgi:methylated-DNA-protein-cysteine methyltransferase-like protein
MTEISERILAVIRVLPAGRIASYRDIAAAAGAAGGARLVARLLHATRAEDGLPWFRIIKSDGRIAFPPGSPGFAVQKELLEAEGWTVDKDGKVSRALPSR